MRERMRLGKPNVACVARRMFVVLKYAEYNDGMHSVTAYPMNIINSSRPGSTAILKIDARHIGGEIIE